MVKKVLLFSLLGICLMGFLGNQAWAAVTCPPECVYKVGSRLYCGYPNKCITAGGVWTTLLGYGLGNVFKEGEEVLLGISVTTEPGAEYAVICSNNGGNVAPGSSPVPSLDPNQQDSFKIVDATQATKNGRVEVTVHAIPDDEFLTALEGPSGENLVACPNAQNWWFSDAVPCNMKLVLQQREIFEFNGTTKACVTADATYDCDLVNDNGNNECSVDIDPSTKELIAKDFKCEEISSNTYRPYQVDGNGPVCFPYPPPEQ